MNNGHLSLIVITAVVLILLVILVKNSRDLKERLSTYETRAENLQESIEAEKERTLQIDSLKAHMATDAYAEEIARERLGLVKENEIVFQEETRTEP